MDQPLEYKADIETPPASLRRFDSVIVRFRRLARNHLIAALIVHIVFLVAFWLLNVWVLAVVNIFSVLIYGICLAGLKYPRIRPVTRALAWFEIIAHAAIACLLLGVASGFHYYLLVLIPFLFIDPHSHTRTRIAGLGLLMGLFVGLDLMTRHAEPWIQLSSHTLTLMRTSNSVLCFMSLGSLINFYAQASRKSERDLRRLASTDLLTGIRNRRSLIDKAARYSRDSDGDHKQSAFILVDLDHFKQLNDRYGHAFGDTVLSQTANLMDTIMRPNDSLARWGGEEFLVLVTNADVKEASRVAERIRSAIASQDFHTEEGTVKITATLGVSQWQAHESLDSCVSRADDALYRGKQKGRNCVEAAGDDQAPPTAAEARPGNL